MSQRGGLTGKFLYKVMFSGQGFLFGNIDTGLVDVVRALTTFWLDASGLLRMIVFFLVWLGIWLPVLVPCAIALNWRPFQPLTATQKIVLLASLYLLAPGILWSLAQIEGGSLATWGLVWQPKLFISLVWGISIGLLGLVLLFGLQWLFKWTVWPSLDRDAIADSRNDPNPATGSLQSVLLPTFLLGVWIGGTEELIFRGFLFNQLQQDYAIWIAATLSSAIFASLHLVWGWRDTLPQLPGLWLMGMVLVLALWADGGNLGLAWGLHAGWVWAIAVLDSVPLIADTRNAPGWLVGLGGKPLAGVMGLALLLVTGALVWQLSPFL